MDALERLENIAIQRGWELRLELIRNTTVAGCRWQIDFGPRDDPDRVQHISTNLWEDAVDMMIEHIVRTGLDNWPGKKD